MLNTSLHNPSVKDKPAPEQFVAMNRGINNGGDLPQELLLVSYSIYNLYHSPDSVVFKQILKYRLLIFKRGLRQLAY